MGNAVTNFIEPILAVIPTPKTDSLEGFVAAYAKVLGEFDDDVLDMACNNMLRRMKFKSMPMPADCIEACQQAETAIALAKARASRVRPKIPEQFTWTAEDAANADKLFASHWGERAVADGVELALWDFLVKKKQWPNGMEYNHLKSASKARQADLKDFLKLQKETCGIKSSAKGWLNTMRGASDRLKRLVEGDKKSKERRA